MPYAFIGPNNGHAAIDRFTFNTIEASLIENGISYTITYDAETNIKAIAINSN